MNAITIATNMAGRGTDIKLGGKFETDTKNDFNNQEIKKMKTKLNLSEVCV